MVLTSLTNDELVRHLRDTELTETERDLLDRLTSALDEIDALTDAVMANADVSQPAPFDGGDPRG